MNIYLLTQTENDGYDTYDSCVVYAETEDYARRIHPCGDSYHWMSKYPTWASHPDNVDVKFLGIGLGYKPGVILASFNAG